MTILIFKIYQEKNPAKCWINMFYRLVQSILDLTLFGKEKKIKT